MAIVTGGLMGYWNSRQGVNGTTWANLAGAAPTLQLINGVTVTEKDTRGLFFDGVAAGTQATAYDFGRDGTVPFTIEIGFEPTDISTTGTLKYFLGSDGTTASSVAGWDHYQGTVAYNTSAYGYMPSGYHLTATPVILTFRFDPAVNASQQDLYVNGAFNSSMGAVHPGALPVLTTNMEFINVKGNNSLPCYVSFLRVYNRALTDSEISQNFQNGTAVGLSAPPTGTTYTDSPTLTAVGVASATPTVTSGGTVYAATVTATAVAGTTISAIRKFLTTVNSSAVGSLSTTPSAIQPAASVMSAVGSATATAGGSIQIGACTTSAVSVASATGSQVTVVVPNRTNPGPFSTAGNGGRKLVRLNSGRIVALAMDYVYGTVFLYWSDNDGATWSNAQVYGTSNTVVEGAIALSPDHSVLYILTSNFYTGPSRGFIVIDVFGTSGIMGRTLDSTGILRINPATDTDVGTVSTCVDSTGKIHVAYAAKDGTYPNSFNIKYMNSTDGGATFSAPVQITTENTTGVNSQNPSISMMSDNNPIIVWDYADTTNKSIYKAWLYAGSWRSGSLFNTGTGLQKNPSVLVKTTGSNIGRIFSVWHGLDATDTTKQNIRVSYSDDGAFTWAAAAKITTGNTVDRQKPTLSELSNGDVFVFYEDGAGISSQVCSNGTTAFGGANTFITSGSNPSATVKFPKVIFTDASMIKYTSLFTIHAGASTTKGVATTSVDTIGLFRSDSVVSGVSTMTCTPRVVNAAQSITTAVSTTSIAAIKSLVGNSTATSVATTSITATTVAPTASLTSVATISAGARQILRGVSTITAVSTCTAQSVGGLLIAGDTPLVGVSTTAATGVRYLTDSFLMQSAAQTTATGRFLIPAITTATAVGSATVSAGILFTVSASGQGVTTASSTGVRVQITDSPMQAVAVGTTTVNMYLGAVSFLPGIATITSDSIYFGWAQAEAVGASNLVAKGLLGWHNKPQVNQNWVYTNTATTSWTERDTSLTNWNRK